MLTACWGHSLARSLVRLLPCLLSAMCVLVVQPPARPCPIVIKCGDLTGRYGGIGSLPHCRPPLLPRLPCSKASHGFSLPFG